MERTRLTHIDRDGNAIMVDVSEKKETARQATASGRITLQPETFNAVREGAIKKGNVLGTAQVAGIMGTKRTGELIPMCHPLFLEKSTVTFVEHEETSEIEVICTAKVTGKTGVEMEALTGVTVALLTIYDMCKGMDKEMTIHSVMLLEKTGGKSGHYQRKTKE